MPRPARPVLERVLAKVEVTPFGCWQWTGARAGAYGHVRLGSQAAGFGVVHRVVWEALVGPIPVGLELDHLCRNHLCASPEHLEPVPHLLNVRRGIVRPAGRIRRNTIGVAA